MAYHFALASEWNRVSIPFNQPLPSRDDLERRIRDNDTIALHRASARWTGTVGFDRHLWKRHHVVLPLCVGACHRLRRSLGTGLSVAGGRNALSVSVDLCGGRGRVAPERWCVQRVAQYDQQVSRVDRGLPDDPVVHGDGRDFVQ